MALPDPPRTPPHNSPISARTIIGSVIVIVVLLVLIGQCGSGSETDGSVPTTSSSATPSPTPDVATIRSVPPPDTTGGETNGGIPPLSLEPPAPAPEPAITTTNDYGGGAGADDSDADSGGFVYYKNCTAARAAGAAPLHVGEPGYATHLDRDGDGVACE